MSLCQVTSVAAAIAQGRGGIGLASQAGQATGQTWRGRRAPHADVGLGENSSPNGTRASTPCRRPRPAPGMTHHR